MAIARARMGLRERGGERDSSIPKKKKSHTTKPPQSGLDPARQHLEANRGYIHSEDSSLTTQC